MTVIAQDDHLTTGAWAACGNVLNLGKLFPSHGLLGFKHGKFPSAGK